jgi:hypothetical protein
LGRRPLGWQFIRTKLEKKKKKKKKKEEEEEKG